MKTFSKSKVNYRKYERKVMSRQSRRGAKQDIAQQPQERNCDHQFTCNDYLCKKCGLYFPETNG